MRLAARKHFHVDQQPEPLPGQRPPGAHTYTSPESESANAAVAVHLSAQQVSGAPLWY